MTQLVKPLRNGQITIPASLRRGMGIDENSLLQVSLVGDELRIKPVQVTGIKDGSSWARELYELFAPVRKEAAKYSEKEINDDIDKAVAEVRREQRKYAGRS